MSHQAWAGREERVKQAHAANAAKKISDAAAKARRDADTSRPGMIHRDEVNDIVQSAIEDFKREFFAEEKRLKTAAEAGKQGR